MLKKLYKHEFAALYRSVLPVYIGLLLLTGLTRLVDLLPTGPLWLRLIIKSTTVLYGLGMVAMAVIVLVMIVTRFSRNLFSAEGYLTFSMPIKVQDHLICKLICGSVAVWTTALVVLFADFLLKFGTPAFDAFHWFVRSIWGSIIELPPVQAAVLMLEIVLLAVVITVYNLLMFYTATCIGQQFKKRTRAAVITYMIIYSIMQTVGILGIYVISLLENSIERFINDSAVAAISLLLAVIIIGYGIVSVLFYCIGRNILLKKLNLQ